MSGRFAEALRELGRNRDIDETLQFAVELATELVPEADVADIMFVRRGNVSVPVSTDPLALAVDQLQADVGEGPCLSAFEDESIVVVDDLQESDRWPRFTEGALELGVRSVTAYRLFVNDEGGEDRMGALNLFGRRPGIAATSIALGSVFASHCSGILRAAIQHEGLSAALNSRDVIGQAKGILMERHRISADQAYELLRRASQQRNLKVRDLADDVAQTGQLPE